MINISENNKTYIQYQNTRFYTVENNERRIRIELDGMVVETSYATYLEFINALRELEK